MDDNAITAIVGWPTEPQMVQFRAIAAAAEQAEREACAKICEDVGDGDENWTITVGEACASAIRKRSKVRADSVTY